VLDKGHFEVSAEYFSRDSVNDATARPYGDPAHSCQTTGSFSSSTNPQVLSCNIRQANVSPFGLIASGPKKGLQFSADGKAIIAFDPGTTTGTGNANIGGDGGVLHNQTLISADHNGQVYGRFDYDLTRDLSFYADARYGASYTSGASQGYTNTDAAYPIWLYSGNPFFTEEVSRAIREEHPEAIPERLPDTVQAAIAARIDQLPSGEKRGLHYAAVLGHTFAQPPIQLHRA